jgi:hypothetical protein
LHDEVRILIFDHMTENERRKHPGSGSREGELSNSRARAARAMHEFFFEHSQNPTRARGAGSLRQLSSNQLNSIKY